MILCFKQLPMDQGCQKIVIDQSMTIFCDDPFLKQAKIVIDRSITFLECCFKTVIDRSMTICKGAPPHMVSTPLKTVIDRSMTIFEWPQSELSLTGQWHFVKVHLPTWCRPYENCHWPVNDTFVKVHIPTWCQPSKTVIDWSMTVCKGAHPHMVSTLWKLSLTSQWQFSEGCSKTVIDQSMTVL